MPDELGSTTADNDPFERALAELLQAEERGEPPDVTAVVRAAPELETPLREFFRHRDGFDRLAPRLGPTAARSGAPAPPPDLPPGSRFAGYEILAELGRGGMGIVYHARQLAPKREVALKVIRTDRLANLTADDARLWMERFRREAQLVASLDQHPNLVTLYEVGEADGRPFFTMQLVRGGSLGAPHRQPALVAARQREAAKLVAAVARAVHHAHRHGVLHRDLKPANILLDADGRPLVSDFGLARRLDQSGSLVAGAIEGTASYMPPEQARGTPGAATTAADVYGLGAVLYELLTGRPPFQGASDYQTLMQVMHHEPVPPRSHNPRLPRDLEIICLKCLEKEPHRRYTSAAALAEDLDNWLAGRPIQARPVGVAGRLWRWARRNPTPAAAAATVLIVASVAVGLIVRSRNDAVDAAALAERRAGENAALARQKDILAQEEKRQRLAVQGEVVRLAAQEGLHLCERGETARGLPYLAYGVGVAEKAGLPDLAHALRANLAAWGPNLVRPRAVLAQGSARRIRRALMSPDGHRVDLDATEAGGGVALSPDGRLVAVACDDGAVRLVDATTGELRGQPLGAPRQTGRWPAREPALTPAERVVTPLPPEEDPADQVTFSPDGRLLAVATLRGRVRVWQIAGGRLLHEFRHHDGRRDLVLRDTDGSTVGGNGVVALAFRPGGNVLMAAGQAGVVRLWDAVSGERRAELNHPGRIAAADFSPDGNSLLVGCTLPGNQHGLAVCWDTATLRQRYRRVLPEGAVCCLAFSPDGRWFATGSGKYPMDGGPVGAARLWEAVTGEPAGPESRFDDPVAVVAFNPDGRHWLAASHEGTFRYFDLEGDDGFETLSTTPATGRHAFGTGTGVAAAAFMPDGRTFVTAGEGVKAWDVRGRTIGETLRVHPAFVHTVAFSPDGRTMLTAAADGGVRLWEVPTMHAPLGGRLSLPTSVARLVFSRDSRRLLMGTLQGAALLYDLSGTEPLVWLRHEGGIVPSVDLSPDGRVALTGDSGGTARLWDVATGRRLGELHGLALITTVLFSPDGRTAAVGTQPLAPQGAQVAPDPGGVQLWDVSSRRPHPGKLWPGANVWAVAFSPDSRTLAVAAAGTVRLYDVADGKARGTPFEHGDGIEWVVFSPDDKLLLTAGTSSRARLWDVATGKAVRDLPHGKRIVAATFAPDGSCVLTASLDGTAQLWRTATGEPAGPALVHRQPVTAAALGRDGRTVLTGCIDGTVRLWDALAGLPIGPPAQRDQPVTSVALSPDGRTAVFADSPHQGGPGLSVDVRTVPPPLAGPPDRVRMWTEWLTGFTHDTDQAVRLLDADRWQQARDALPHRDREPPVPDMTAWHRRQAEECERAGQWFPAQWHLRRLLEGRPNDGTLLRRVGVALARLGSWDRASEMLTSAIAHGADGADTRRECAVAFWRLGQRGRAEAEFAAALERWPNAWALWYAHGQVRIEAGRWLDAADDLRRAAALPGAPADVGRDCALACLRVGDPAGYGAACAALMRRASEANAPPQSGLATATMVWACCVSAASGVDAGRLVQLGQQAADGHPADTPDEEYVRLRALGASLYRAGKDPQAVAVLRRATALQAETPTVWLLLAMSHHHLGNAREARRMLQAARAWMNDSHYPTLLAHHVAWVAGAAAAPGELSRLGALAPLAELRPADPKDARHAKPWGQIPWQEQVALGVLRGEAEYLIAGRRRGR
jgi:WD40 repeat protein/Flp pilus assembly protein TadD/tRNA A-37 threonylcarbamoyl transferase component Bud32